MAADTLGNDISAVGIPITGQIAYAPYGTALPTPEAGSKKELTLNAAFKRLGLMTEDGGPEWALEKDGDNVPFHQEGYSIPSGMANASITFTLAQTDPITQEFIRGAKYDAHGHIVVDAAGSAERFAFWAEDIFKNGTIRRRACANGMIKEVKEVKLKRGEVLGYEITVELNIDASHPTGHFHEWLIYSNTEEVGG